jgi:hypothetical protein
MAQYRVILLEPSGDAKSSRMVEADSASSALLIAAPMFIADGEADQHSKFRAVLVPGN